MVITVALSPELKLNKMQKILLINFISFDKFS